MKVPITWLKDFVDIKISVEELAHVLTMAGLEVEAIQYVGLPMPDGKIEGRPGAHNRPETKISGIEWEPDKVVVAAINEVMPHPNADRLVLCRLDDGQVEQIVLTGAPNLFPYKGQGPLEKPLKVAYAKEGARIYDGHQPGQVLTTLKRTKIRGVESYSMVCSEKELGISEEHEGIIILDEDAPVGMPLVEYMGDAVLEIAIIPNIARAASIFGVAREVAALTGVPLKQPDLSVKSEGPSIQGRARIEIKDSQLNPRFVLGLIEGVEVGDSPYWVQRRLRLAGMRPISNIVDATNYAMLELGEPLHAFDYDVLVERAGGKAPTIITRTAQPGERLTTLDGVDRQLDQTTVLVTDTAGPLSIAGVMGGFESEVSKNTRNILLEGAAWNYINIRKTATSQKLMSEAAYRFSRGVHPAVAEQGVMRGLELIRRWSGGTVSQGLVDNYPLPPVQPVVTVTPKDVRRWLGIDLASDEIAEILRRLQFAVTLENDNVHARTPEHRMDIGEGIIGVADLMEEVARVYGYERIPETRMADELPPQLANTQLEREERVRDILVTLGVQEVITHRMTSPEREGRRLPEDAESDNKPYAQIMNPIAPERSVLRHSLLSNLLEIAERNARIRERIALFEIGPVFLQDEEGELPEEIQRLDILMTGQRELPSWQDGRAGVMDFFDLKGIIESLLAGLHVQGVVFEPWEHPSFHPGKCARMILNDQQLGVMGELHPLVQENYELEERTILSSDLDLGLLINSMPERFGIRGVPEFPPVLEDIAVIVDEEIPAGKVEEVIRKAGGKLVTEVRLFDVYRGPQIGSGKKSLAYGLTYQDPERTLNDQDSTRIRQKIVRKLADELGAVLRS